MPHLSTLWKAIVLSFIINYFVIASVQAATPASSSLGDDNVALETSDWGTGEDEEFMPSFMHVKKLFNEGKPFFVEKDPVSGQFDFNHKKSAGVVENYRSPAEELIPLRTNEISPNIHDFLHLPVKYSSSKSVYPLVSSSYANTKYQGSNNEKDGSNHKEYSNVEIQKHPNFFTSNAIFPFEKTGAIRTTTTSTPKPAPVRTQPTVTTFKPSFPRRPTRPIPTRFQEPSQHWQRTEYPTTTTTTTAKFTPTIPTTTTTRAPYSPTVPTTTTTTSTQPPPTTTTRKFEPPSTEKIPSASNFVTTTAAPTTQTTTTTTTNKPLVFPTEPMSLMEMLNNFADDSNPNVNAIQINENAHPFQRPSGFRPAQSSSQKDVVARQPPPPPPPTTTTVRPFNSSPMVQFNDYVKYDIQAPNMVSFHSNEPVSSMNNIKISPDQNVASFVLGSKQSFGGIGGDNQVQLQTNAQGPPKVIGQVFNEPISGAAVSIRFPSKEEETRFENVPVITGAHKNVPNGHSAPFGFNPSNQQHVSFPVPSTSGSFLANGQDSKMVGTKIVFESNDQVNSNTNPFPTREVLPLKGNPNQRPIHMEGHDQGLNAPPLPNQQEPQRNRPPFPQKYFHEFSSQGQTSNNGPPPPAQGQGQQQNRPNILPQFRPNTNPKPGHHPHQYKESNGYRHPYMPNTNRRVFPGPPPPSQHGPGGAAFKRPFSGPNPSSGPPMRPYTYQSNRFQSKMAPAPPPPPTKEQIEANRRMYKLPQTQPLYAAVPRINPHLSGHQQPQASDRVYHVRPQYPDMYNGMNPGNAEPSTLKNNYIDEDSYKMPPKQEILPNGETKLEPVVTLQMIHTKKIGQGTKLSTLHADIPKNGIPSGPAPVNGTDKPVYVVYPIHEKPTDTSIVIGQRGEAGPVPPQAPELNVASGAYQNTPFTVIHHEQQPILTTLQKHLSVPKSPNRTNFPYQLEQPDPNSASELDSKTRRKDHYYPVQDSIYNIGEQPVQPQVRPKILNKPDTISAKLPMVVTERPAIAIAYTPSTRAPQQQHQKPQTAQQNGGYYNHYSMPNYDSAVIPEILDNFQSTPFKKDELDAAYPAVGDYYEKDFQAPFHPSINLGTISDSYQGWAILDRTTKRTNEVESKNSNNNNSKPQKNGNEIDRKDMNKNELIIGDFTSESKDPIATEGGFQPELEGGFRPIVPPHLMNVDHHEMAMKLDEDIPIAEKQVARNPQRPAEMVIAKDSMVDISAEKEVPMSEPLKSMDRNEEEKAVEGIGEEEEVEEEELSEDDQEEEQEAPQKMSEPERRPMNVVPTEAAAAPQTDSSATTEKVMSFEDALSAIFGLSDEGFEEMTTKSQSNDLESKSRSS